MNSAPSSYKIPKKLEPLLAQLSSYYAQQNNPLYQKLIVNCQYYLEENVEQTIITTESGYNYPIPGHAIHLSISQAIYSEILSQIHEIKNILQKDINTICETSICNDEYICRIYIEIQENEKLKEWRKNSGALVQNTFLTTVADEEDLHKIWEKGFLKIFLSHKSEKKFIAAELKESLTSFGVSCFVAHEDIEPTNEWQKVIEKALSTADALIPLLTEGFYDSQWTEQEVGIAMGQGIFIIPVKFGADPRGFIGKYQAVSGNNKTMHILAKELFDLMYKNESLKERVIDAVVSGIERSRSFSQTNTLIPYLTALTTLPSPLIARLEKAYENNSQVQGAFAAEADLLNLIDKWKQKS